MVFPTWPRPAAEKKLVLRTASNDSCGLRDPEESPIKPASQHYRHEQRRFNSVSIFGIRTNFELFMKVITPAFMR